MAKHRHKSYEGNDMSTRRPIGSMNNNPFGINPQQLLSMLGGNVDMNGLGNLLTAMNKNGFDLNSLNNLNNLNVNPNNNANTNNNNSNSTNNNNHVTKNNNPTQSKKKSEDNEKLESEEDENIEFLEALKKMVDTNKIEFIDKIIELYNKGAFKDNFD